MQAIDKGFPEMSSTRFEKLYLMLLDAIPSSLLMINRDLRILEANRNFLQKSKRTTTNTIGYRLDEVFPAIILDQMEISRRIRQVFELNRATSGDRFTYRAPGLPTRIYYYILLPFSLHGVVESVLFLMEDVSEQVRLSEDVHRLERHLASVVECASDIILSTDTNGRILTWNAAAEKISGYSLYEVRGKYLWEFSAEQYVEDVQKVFVDMQNREDSIMAEWDLITRDVNSVPVYWVFSPLDEGWSQSVGIVAVGRDLTERRKLEAQLLQSQKLAALGVMAGGIAHEIRNPLTICSSAAQFLKEDEPSPEFRKECAEKIHAGIQRASIIIENLLRFARPSAKADAAAVNFGMLIEETLTLVRNQARIQKIEVFPEFPKEPIMINGIASLLEQVFMNLFLNAINAMPDGGCLRVRLCKRGSQALVDVADTGVGINEADVNMIFDPFYTTSPVGRGTGLGLSLCYSIIKHHFGSIEVESSKGGGSTFTVILPSIG
ncbi:MAG: ATP-binding protein [Syntrophobacteraceae bacterium]